MANLNALEEKELEKAAETILIQQRRIGFIAGGKAICRGVVDIIDQSTLSNKDTLALIRKYCVTGLGEDVNKS